MYPVDQLEADGYGVNTISICYPNVTATGIITIYSRNLHCMSKNWLKLVINCTLIVGAASQLA